MDPETGWDGEENWLGDTEGVKDSLEVSSWLADPDAEGVLDSVETLM